MRCDFRILPNFMAFAPASAQTEPPDHVTEEQDTAVTTAVYITERTAGHWRLRAYQRGIKDRYRYLAGTREDAERAAEAWRADIEQFGHAPGHPSKPLGDWIRDYLSRKPALALRTRDWYEDVLLRRFIDPPDDVLATFLPKRSAFISGADPGFRIGRRAIGRISTADGINWIRWMQDAHHGKHRAIYAAFHLARAALADAAALRIIPSNPWDKLRHQRVATQRVVVPTKAEIRKVGEVAVTDERLQLLLDLALATGARRGELLALKWRHIDLDSAPPRLAIHGALQESHGVISVKLPKTRTGARTISLPPHILPQLRRTRAIVALAMAPGESVDERPVFPSRSDPAGWWSPSAASPAARRALHQAGVKISLHALRHGHATALLSARVNPAAVQHRLGHANAGITLDIYGHVMPDDDNAAAALAIQRALGKIA